MLLRISQLVLFFTIRLTRHANLFYALELGLYSSKVGNSDKSYIFSIDETSIKWNVDEITHLLRKVCALHVKGDDVREK